MARRLMVLNAGEGTVSRLDADSGRELLRRDLDRAVPGRGRYLSPYLAAGDGERLYIICRADDLLICVSPDGGTVHYVQAVPAGPSSVAVGDGCVYVSCADADAILQFEAATGRYLRMVRTLPYPVRLWMDGALYCACVNGKCVTAYAPDLTALDTLALAGMPMDLIADHGRLYIAQMAIGRGGAGLIDQVRTDLTPPKRIRLDLPPGRICALRDGLAVSENGGTELRFLNLALECTAALTLSATAEEMCFDGEKERLYVSLGAENEIAVIEKRQTVGRWPVGLSPAGMLLTD